MPSCALSRPATSSRLVSELLRGAGPPKSVSIACCCASPALRPAVPATGGARLKSGGTNRGALRATANSSGVAARLWAQPLAASAATARAAIRVLRMFDGLLVSLLTSEEGSQQQDDNGNADRRIADVEDEERPPLAEVQVAEVDDIAKAHPVADIPEGPAQHHSQRKLVDAILLPPDPDRDSDRDCGGQSNERPPPDRVGRVQQPERDPLVLGEGEVEDRQDRQLVPDLVEPERTGDGPLRELVENEHDQRYGEAEAVMLHHSTLPSC